MPLHFYVRFSSPLIPVQFQLLQLALSVQRFVYPPTPHIYCPLTRCAAFFFSGFTHFSVFQFSFHTYKTLTALSVAYNFHRTPFYICISISELPLPIYSLYFQNHKNHITCNSLNCINAVFFVNNITYLGITFNRMNTYSLFKSSRLSTNIKLTLYKILIRSVISYACPTWEYAAGARPLKL
jgi:hypothetical protein